MIYFFFFSICFCWCAIAVVSYAIHHCTLIISPSLFIFTGTYQTVQDKMASFLTDTFIVRSASKKSREMRWNCQMIPLNLSRKFTHHISLSLSLSSSLMKIKPVVFCNMLLLKFFGNLKYCLTFIVFHLEKFQKVSFLNWKMISWIMNLLWNVMNVDEKCIKFVSFTLSLFGLMGKLLLIMYLS